MFLNINPKPHSLCPLSPSTCIYSHPPPPFLLSTVELENLKIKIKLKLKKAASKSVSTATGNS